MFLVPRKTNSGRFIMSSRIHIVRAENKWTGYYPGKRSQGVTEMRVDAYCNYYTYYKRGNGASFPRKHESPWFRIVDILSKEERKIPFCKKCLSIMAQRGRSKPAPQAKFEGNMPDKHALVRRELKLEE